PKAAADRADGPAHPGLLRRMNRPSMCPRWNGWCTNLQRYVERRNSEWQRLEADIQPAPGDFLANVPRRRVRASEGDRAQIVDTDDDRTDGSAVVHCQVHDGLGECAGTRRPSLGIRVDA